MKNAQLLCKALGGSRAYGLDTPTSDLDVRGVFLNTDMSYVLGLKKYEHQEVAGEDVKMKEIRRFFNLLSQSNTEAVELLYSPDNAFSEMDDLFREIRGDRARLVDSTQMLKCLRGYSLGERKLANGERTGTLGGKRKESVGKYGFSPKNFVQLLRLNWAGEVFFQLGFFPVNVKETDAEFAKFLLDIKTNPQNYKKEELNVAADFQEKKLLEAFDNRKFNFTFDNELANSYVLRAYYPLVHLAHYNGWNKFRSIMKD